MQKFILLLNRIFFNLVTDITLSGKANLPEEEESCIVVSNHIGRLDAFVIFYLFDRPDLIVMAAEKYQEYAVSRWVGNMMDVIWIDRFNADFRALREIYNRLREGGVVVMAPEGTRSPTKSLQPGKLGAAYLASKVNVPIIPASITGSEDDLVVERLRKFQRVPLNIRIGESFTLPPLPRKNREQALREFTDTIMCHIAALLPPPYRGVYADHPCLQELLQGTSKV